jgi:hypothetical protein
LPAERLARRWIKKVDDPFKGGVHPRKGGGAPLILRLVLVIMIPLFPVPYHIR